MPTNVWIEALEADVLELSPMQRALLDRADRAGLRSQGRVNAEMGDDASAVRTEPEFDALVDDLSWEAYKQMRIALDSRRAVLSRELMAAASKPPLVDSCLRLFQRYCMLGFGSPVWQALEIIGLLIRIERHVPREETAALAQYAIDDLERCRGACDENIATLRTFLPASAPEETSAGPG